MSKIIIGAVCVIFLWNGQNENTQAAALRQVSDTISTSAPSVNANHTIQFTTATALPVSGKIKITLAPGDFTIPSALGFSDVDLTINSSAKNLAASAGTGSGAVFGIAVTSGTNGSITITLNDMDAIDASSTIIIKIGANATIGGSGAYQIQNPSVAGSYTINVQTLNSSNATIDEMDAMIAIIQSIATSGGSPSPAPAPTPAPPPQTSGGAPRPAPTPISLMVPTPTPTITPPISPKLPTTALPTPTLQSVAKNYKGVFFRSINIKSQGKDVKSLQQFLNAVGFTVAKSGPGSKGKETTYFGQLTRAALAKFQAANKIKPAVGYFGPITRAFIQSLAR